MRVRTIRKHGNGYPPQYVKNVGRHYEVPDKHAASLINSGLVAKVTAKKPKPKVDEGLD